MRFGSGPWFDFIWPRQVLVFVLFYPQPLIIKISILILSFQVFTLLPQMLSLTNLISMVSISSFKLLDINDDAPKARRTPWCMLLILETFIQHASDLVICMLWEWSFKQLLIQLTKINNQLPFLNLYLFIFYVIKDFIKCLANIQIYFVYHISHSYQLTNSAKNK